jgi:hypothetical protein
MLKTLLTLKTTDFVCRQSAEVFSSFFYVCMHTSIILLCGTFSHLGHVLPIEGGREEDRNFYHKSYFLEGFLDGRMGLWWVGMMELRWVGVERGAGGWGGGFTYL